MRIAIAIVCILLNLNSFSANILEPIHRFGTNAASGINPEDRLVLSANGFLYGTTSSGGAHGWGTVYRIKPAGTEYSILHHFQPTLLDGGTPLAGLTLDAANGTLFGTTQSGGTFGLGTVYCINLDGSGYSIIKSFNGLDGEAPQAGLLIGLDGALYGTTYSGGANKSGTVFKINKSGTGFITLRSFQEFPPDGRNPKTTLVQDSNGVLFGATYQGGANVSGTLYKLNANGSGYGTLFSFSSSLGIFSTGLTLASNGLLYGTRTGGNGSLYRISRTGTNFFTLRSFNGFPDGAEPTGAVFEGSDGFLYGTTSQGGSLQSGTVYRIDKNGANYSIIHAGTSTTASDFRCSLIESSAGVLYGIAIKGGVCNTGSVFKLNKDGGSFSILKTFGAGDGLQANALIRGNDGALYGTSSTGGSSGMGILFKLQGDGSGFTVVRNFDVNTGAASPAGGLTAGANGYLYGCTSSSANGAFGTVYKVKMDGSDFAVLKEFTNTNESIFPEGPLLLASNGFLYGTTRFYGSNGKGTLFKLNSDGGAYAEVKNFEGDALGEVPDPRLFEGSDGAIYGSASRVIYKINKDGSNFTVLKVFDPQTGPSNAEGGVVEGSDGAMYSVSRFIDGLDLRGSIFKLAKNGTGFASIRTFVVEEGYLPEVGITKGGNGSFYGSTRFGAANDSGSLFRTDGTGGNFTILKVLTTEFATVGLPLVYGRATTIYGANLFSSGTNYGSLYRLELNAALQIAEGNQQRTLTETPFAAPIRVRAVDSGGQPVGGVRVRFEVPSSSESGSFSGAGVFNSGTAIVVTDANGYASAPTLTANALTGAFQLRASFVSAPEEFVDFTLYNVDFALTNLSAPENSAVGTAAGTLVEVGAAAGADTLVFTLVAGVQSDDNALFTISGFSVKTAAILNFENRANYSIRVRATRPGGSSREKVFVLTVQNANDAPTIANKPFAVSEKAPVGTVVGSLTGSDEDVGQSLSYAISSGNAAGVFTIGATTGQITVLDPSTLNFETTPEYNLTVTVTDNAGIPAAASGFATIQILKANLLPPVATSGFTVTPNPSSVGRPVTLSVVAVDPEGQPVTVNYNYGDGSTGTSNTHTYGAPLSYTLTATVSDGELSLVLTKELVVLAAANPNSDVDGDGIPNSADADDDGDGLPDDMEMLAGSDPFSAASTPLTDNAPAGTPEPFSVEKLGIQLNFAKANVDTIKLSGLLPIAEGFETDGTIVVLNAGGVTKGFTLNAKGWGRSSKNETLVLSVKSKRGTIAAQYAKFKAFLRGSFSTALADDGLENANMIRVNRNVKISVLFDGHYLQATQTLSYSARQGKTGRAK